MAEPQSNAYKNERRQKARILTREALFVHEYVKTKYENIYVEAAKLYNEINQTHPRKPDLRKSLEFRVWRNQVAASKGQPQTPIPRPKEHYYNRIQYSDINITQTTGKPKEKRMVGKLLTANLNIPLISMPQQPAEPTTDTVPIPAATDTVPIPAAGPASTDEIDDMLLMDSSITDELMPEMVDQIIRDLQADPTIREMMNDIENTYGIENTEEGIPELEVDLPDYLGEEMDMCW